MYHNCKYYKFMTEFESQINFSNEKIFKITSENQTNDGAIVRFSLFICRPNNEHTELYMDKHMTTPRRQQTRKINIKMKIYDGTHENINKFHSRYSLWGEGMGLETPAEEWNISPVACSPRTSSDTHTHPVMWFFFRSKRVFYFNARHPWEFVFLLASSVSSPSSLSCLLLLVGVADWCSIHTFHSPTYTHTHPQHIITDYTSYTTELNSIRVHISKLGRVHSYPCINVYDYSQSLTKA